MTTLAQLATPTIWGETYDYLVVYHLLSRLSFTNLGYVSLDAYHGRDDCVSFTHTHHWFAAGCNLPRDCGSPHVETSASTWYQSEVLMCYSTGHCAPDSVCGSQHSFMPLYSISSTMTSYSAMFSLETGNRSRLQVTPDPYRLVKDNFIVYNANRSLYYVYTRRCIEASFRYVGRHEAPPHFSTTVSADWTQACIRYLDTHSHGNYCQPLSSGPTLLNAISRAVLVECQGSACPTCLGTCPAHPGIPHNYLYCSSVEYYGHSAPSCAPVTYQCFEYPFNTTKCYNVPERLANPLSGILDSILSSVSYIVQEIVEASLPLLERIVYFVLDLVKRLALDLVNWLFSLPQSYMIPELIFSYVIIYYYYSLSHTITISTVLGLFVLSQTISLLHS